MGESKPEPKPDKKRVTLRDVAEEAGVSLKTASNVINHSGRMTDSTREKVQEVIDRLGYRVNVSARNLNRGKTGFITLAVPTLTAPYLSELANRVIDAARGYGYSVYVTTYAEGSAQGAQSLLRNFNTTVSDGMILSISEVENLEAADLDVDYPLVCVGARSTHGKADHVTPDDIQEARLAAEELAVGRPAAAGDQPPPLPGILFLVPRPPIEVGGVLLRGEAVYLVFEQGQEAHLVNQADELLPALGAAGVIPVQPPHDPLAVLDRHRTASPEFFKPIIAHSFYLLHSGEIFSWTEGRKGKGGGSKRRPFPYGLLYKICTICSHKRMCLVSMALFPW